MLKRSQSVTALKIKTTALAFFLFFLSSSVNMCLLSVPTVRWISFIHQLSLLTQFLSLPAHPHTVRQFGSNVMSLYLDELSHDRHEKAEKLSCELTSALTHTHTHIYTHVLLAVSACVCVCVCNRSGVSVAVVCTGKCWDWFSLSCCADKMFHPPYSMCTFPA